VLRNCPLPPVELSKAPKRVRNAVAAPIPNCGLAVRKTVSSAFARDAAIAFSADRSPTRHACMSRELPETNMRAGSGAGPR
jgi:hypothetical protein